ncbi:hypothetical protein R6Q59_007719 [Mikania micrantha]
MEEEFDVSASSSSKKASRKWQGTAINAVRRCSFTDKLKERSAREEDRRQFQAKIQAHAQVLRAAYVFQASGNDIKALKRLYLNGIISATNNFSDENLIAEGALGKVYKGQLLHNGDLLNVVVQMFDCKYGQGDELQTEISKIRHFRHKNIVSVFGFCDEKNEMIIVYKAFYGTLNQHLSDPNLTWSKRIQICLGVARALNHIHYDVIHCDVNSSKIILDEDWEAKIYGFELSTEYPRSWRHRLRFSRHFDTINLTPKYDVYSFGVLLFEVICGRKPMITNYGVQEELDKIINPNLRKQMDIESLALFKNIAYNCLNQQLVQRPTMDQIVKELEDVLDLQWKHANLVYTKAANEGTSSNNLKMDFLNIPLNEIRLATNNFDEANFIGSGGYGKVYKANLDVLNIQSLSSMKGKCKDELHKIRKTVAIKRIFSRADEQGKQGFLREIELLTSCKHPNIVSLLGFSREAREMVLVYEYVFKGSLSDYLRNSGQEFNLTWAQRIQICLDVAHGINYLHTNMKGKPRIIHRDIKSDNILLDENLKAKVADFGLSKFDLMKQQGSTIYTKNIAGIEVYLDPEYLTTLKYKKESDVYSFGVVLFEVLSGRVAYDSIYMDENHMGLAPIARRRFNEETLKELIDPRMIEEDDDHIFSLNRGPNPKSFHTFSKIAYQCLAETQAKSPTMEVVIKKLQKALHLQGDTVVLMRFLLRDITLATENFAETYCIGFDTNGMVYKAKLDHFGNNTLLAGREENIGEPLKKLIPVSVKRMTSKTGGHKRQEFFEEIEMYACKHPNIVHLLGFCDEGDEMILVYEHVSGRSLDDYLKSNDTKGNFVWTHRLHMCIEITRGLNHLHTKMVNPQRIKHIAIKSANILLDKNMGAKIASFVISISHSPNQEIHNKVYEDPTGKQNIESDIYSFGVVLFEIFCGRVAYDPVFIEENEKGLAPIARQCFNDGTIDRIIDPSLKEETGENIKDSLYIFTSIAHQCLGEAANRPTMETVINELEIALNSHESQYFPGPPRP